MSDDRKKAKYRLIDATDRSELQTRVNNAIENEGYWPIGGPFVARPKFPGKGPLSQAMVLRRGRGEEE